VSLDRRVDRRGDDALVLGEEVVGVGVEVRDSADERCPGDEVVDILEEADHEVLVGNVPDDQLVVGVVVVRLDDPPVLRIVVDSDDLIAIPQQFFDDVAADESR